MSRAPVTLLGRGMWGSALAKALQHNRCDLKIWSRSGGEDLRSTIAGSSAIVSAISMAGVPEVVATLKGHLSPQQIVVTTTKGLDLDTQSTPSQIWTRAFPENPIVVLSGPNLSAEIELELPAATVVASDRPEAAIDVQKLFSSPLFRAYTNSDPLGVELGGTVKNVVAIAAGVCDGLELGTNAKAGLITRSLAEIVRIGKYWGAQPETFFGLSGLGDLLATCNSSLSRNYRVGFALGKGEKIDDILANLQGTAEGVNTTRVLMEIAKKQKIEMPIAELVYLILQGKVTPSNAVAALMSRDFKEE
jgi:glycerol-3-phosphate dehydrogenase (NAD(P)+)